MQNLKVRHDLHQTRLANSIYLLTPGSNTIPMFCCRLNLGHLNQTLLLMLTGNNNCVRDPAKTSIYTNASFPQSVVKDLSQTMSIRRGLYKLLSMRGLVSVYRIIIIIICLYTTIYELKIDVKQYATNVTWRGETFRIKHSQNVYFVSIYLKCIMNIILKHIKFLECWNDLLI